jgi:CRISPR-associated endonuclease/helicase Cas3
MSQTFAHYDKVSGGEPLIEHLCLVARRASAFAAEFSASEEGYIAGLLHDLGKYGEAFQQRLKGELKGVDHWSAGAWEALRTYELQGIASALAIQGHHIGLCEASKDSLRGLDPDILRRRHPLNLTLSHSDASQLAAKARKLPAKGTFPSLCCWSERNSSSMLDVRMLFSALVDADFLETEAWFHRDENGNRRYRQSGPSLQPERALAALEGYVQTLHETSLSSSAIQQIRNELLSACLEAGECSQGIFTLTAPTGSGKTLAMLAFALKHALTHNLRRIIVVQPYLTLIEQTALVYREVFQRFVDKDLERYFLEHHSLSGVHSPKNGPPEDDGGEERLLSENWDAPVILTTNVQFLESLFSNRPSACRKLHRLARSVILFDEVQTLPLKLLIPTLGTLSHLVEKYGASVVFATATQPAFSHLDSQVKKHCALGWCPREIVPDPRKLFALSRRNRILLAPPEEVVSLDDLAERVARERQILCVVNLKRHARDLFNKVREIKGQGVFHLSTNMCPAHRRKVLSRVRRLLEMRQPCCLISTQCVEAGVDIDFPVVFRSFAPLDAIAQAAGRCNRNGHSELGLVYVFRPKDTGYLYPDKAYEQATQVAATVLSGRRELDATDTSIFQHYYRELYSVRGLDRSSAEDDDLLNAIARQDFARTCQLYRVIPQDSINVLVPYRPQDNSAVFYELRNEVHAKGLSREWIMKARPYTVALFRPRSAHDDLYLNLEPVKIRPDRPEESDEWYIYRKEEDYDEETGLTVSLTGQVIIA